MSKFTPTPGPWKVKHLFNVMKGNRSIAACGGYTSNSPSDPFDQENQANARLIAKAPEMYAFIQRVANPPEFPTYLDIVTAATKLLKEIEEES